MVYAFIYDRSNNKDAHYFYSCDFSGFDAGGSVSFSNRSTNLPTFEKSIFGGNTPFTTQGGYDMALAVHPTRPHFVVLGYVEVIKSEDAFATDISKKPAKHWIGGNENPDLNNEGISFRGVHHADQHILLFDPKNPNTLWSGHDGGISKTNDVTTDRVAWESKNNNYNVTQYYTVAIDQSGKTTTVTGGTQDNGTPLLDGSDPSLGLAASAFDVSSGDGAFTYVGEKILYASAQNGFLAYKGSNGFFYRFIQRPTLQSLFIHPFAIDPNDEGTMFYTSFGNGILARNTKFDESVQQYNISLVENGWEDFNVGSLLYMTAIKVSKQQPSHKVYFGGFIYGVALDAYLFSWENANTSTDAATMEKFNLSATVAAGSWLSDIAVSPTDGNEIILVYSNYNITGLFHSTDGGETITAIEGNLGENDDNTLGLTGPSISHSDFKKSDRSFLFALILRHIFPFQVIFTIC